MNAEHVDRQIAEMERALIRDDPALVVRFRLRDTRDVRRDRVVFALLAASAILLGVGLWLPWGPAWFVGGVALVVVSLLVDNRYERQQVPPTSEAARRPFE